MTVLRATAGASSPWASAAQRSTGVLVVHRNVLTGASGGVQNCHREYESALAAAGYDLHRVVFDLDRTPLRRLRNRMVPTVLRAAPHKALFTDISSAIRKSGAGSVFFAVTLAVDACRQLKAAFPGLQQVFLSHGIEGIDFGIEQRSRRDRSAENRLRTVAEWMLGKHLLDQAEARRCIDAVLTLSPFEAEMEAWLGAPKVLWLPRTISDSALPSHPIDSRVGCVSTLDHLPNWLGLRGVLEALDGRVGPDFRFRLVGRPRKVGADLAERFAFVDYIGPLSDAELREEASTWCCFTHPLFVNGKGCSTKLATALGWGLPIATTAMGVRGYLWDQAIVPLAASPAELAALVLERASVGDFSRYRAATEKIARLAPTIDAVGQEIRDFLHRDLIPVPPPANERS
jgi:hypothetical protein